MHNSPLKTLKQYTDKNKKISDARLQTEGEIFLNKYNLATGIWRLAIIRAIFTQQTTKN